MTRSTFQQHARIERKMINLDRADPGPMMCAWSDCDRDGVSLYRARTCEHSPRYSCGQTDQGIGGGRHYWHVFCTDRHLQYHVASTGPRAAGTAERNQGRIYGMLPPGYRHAL
jgi:hypothetical protein